MSNREKWTLAVLVMISVWLFADQNAMNPVVREIMAEYRIDERQIGIIGSAFTILGALVSMFFGYFTDRFSRKKLLAFTVLLGEIPCFLTGVRAFTTTYNQLLVLRILTGLGVGGIFPITFSLVGDYFNAEHRATAIAFVSTAWGIGEMLGQVMPGFLAGTYGWRLPFILAAIPNFVLVPVFMLMAREPKRGAREKELADLLKRGFEYTERIKFSDLKAVLANRTNLLGFVQGIPGSIPWGLIPFFLIPFYEGKGFTKEFATMLTLVLGLGATAGGLLGGWAGDRIFRRSPRALPLFCAGAVLAGVAPGYMIMTMHLTPAMGSHAMAMPLVASFLTGVIVTIPSANIKAMLINVNPPERRGSVFGLHNITDSLGRGIGPFLGGMLIRSHGYLYAMLFAVFMWIPCAVLYGAMALTIDGDLSSLGRYLREKRDKIVGAGVSL
ncbi:MAG: MFS transporter [Bacteroidota bacterium]